MKRLILFLFGILIFNCAYAQNHVSFIYINGSNNNDEKMRTWYEKGVKKLHPVLKEKFETNQLIKEKYLNSGGLKINQEPIIFFWGDKSASDLAYVKSQLDISRAISSTGAFFARKLIAQYMHDAIWVQKQHNMLPILSELNESIKTQAKNDNEIILYGYSAGTFITYEYLFNHLRYINLLDMFQTLNYDSDFIEFVKQNPKNNTCVSALSFTKSGIGTFSQDGNVVINQDINTLKKNYLELDSKTEKYCAPDNKVKGVVNFASPLVLFYSDLSDNDYQINYYNKLMTKYIFENGIFWITVNFREDPLGFPTVRNLTINEIQDKLNMQINNPKGIIFDNSSVWSKRFFALAHTSYWTARKIFSKAIVDSFIKGYKFQYDKDYQNAILKKHSKKSELL